MFRAVMGTGGSGVRTAVETSVTGIGDRMLFHRGEPLIVLFRRRLGLSSWHATLTLVVALNIPILVAVQFHGAWLSSSNRVGLLRDYSWILQQISAVPAMVLFHFWLPEGIRGVLAGLQRNRTLILQSPQEDSRERFKRFVRDLDRSYSHWIWPALGFSSALALQLIVNAPAQRQYQTWQTAGPFVFWYTVCAQTVFYYVSALVIVKFVLLIRWINRLFSEFRVVVRVLHPDGAGGLSPLGNLSVKAGYLIAICGLAAVSVTLTEGYVRTTEFVGPLFSVRLLLTLAIYVVLAPVAFFAPIGAGRTAMKTAKNDLLVQIADQFEIDSARIQSLLGADASMLAKGLEKVEQLRKIHGIVSQFPVWPFNTGNLVRFVSSMVSPIVFALATVLKNRLSGG